MRNIVHLTPFVNEGGNYSMPRDNFNPDVKRRLAQRAGYLCSICNKITVGPSAESAEAVNLTGVAAHICAAAPGGRRYKATMSTDKRASIDNGIWLCADHADLIDGDEITFTVDRLNLIKKNHESKIAYMHSGINVEHGLITKIELSNLGLITTATHLNFGERNIILGDNGVGKTLICEMIGALKDPVYLERWKRKGRGVRGANAFCNIEYFRNVLDTFGIAIDDQSQVSYSFNGRLIPLLAPPITVFYLKESFGRFVHKSVDGETREEREQRETNDLVSLLAEYFGLTREAFVNVVASMSSAKKFFINDIKITDGNRGLSIKYSSKPTAEFHPFAQYSSGEQDRILLELTLKIASYYSRFQSTILLIENSTFGVVDLTGINHLLDIVRKENFAFQFFFTSVEKKDKLKTDGYKVYELVAQRGAGVVANAI